MGERQFRLKGVVGGMLLGAAGCAADAPPEPPLGLIPEQLTARHAEALLAGSQLAAQGEAVRVVAHSRIAGGHLLRVEVGRRGGGAAQRASLVYLPRAGRPAWLTGPFDPVALLAGIVRLGR